MSQKTVKVQCKPGVLSIKPFRLELKVNKPGAQPDDTGRWQSDDADLDIIFNKVPGTHPWNWTSDTAPQGAAGKDYGAPTNKQKATHNYTLVIRRPGAPAITVDPEVGVDSGGPPGKHKKAKKKGGKGKRR